jgi:hypothetical protein
MRTRKTSVALAIGALCLALGIALPAVAQDADASLARLGTVRFPVSCNAAAQKEFEVAMAVLPLVRVAAA